ncbi:MAG TPA: ATP-binding protein [Dissulfurispiraceae bacterium]|nr:ATP-binding protein [Dissulfurispiraceae bacterium]
MIRYSFQVDRDLCITACDRAFEQVFRMRAADVIGRPYREAVVPIAVGGLDMLTSSMEDGRLITLQAHPVHSFAGLCYVDISIRPMSVADGTVNGASVTIEPSENFANPGGSQIDVCTLASTLAHGIRNPLNAIKGAAVYLREKYSEEATLLEFVAIMDDEIARLDSFISRFLATTSSGSEFVLVDLDALIERIKLLVGLQAQSRDIQIVISGVSAGHVLADPFHLEQAVLNLVNNALEAMPASGVLTLQGTREQIDGKAYAVISVGDTGPGLGSVMLDIATKPPSDGHGYGLFITREVLRAMGGHMQIQTMEGAGTTVSLYIPAPFSHWSTES